MELYVHRLDLGLYSHPKEFGGMESEPMLTQNERAPLPEKFSSKEGRTHDAASSKIASSTHYQLSYSPSAVTILIVCLFDDYK